jgi:N-acetylglucosaminyl-diphospho-decaprenol L-rhamnosyltransferase
MNSEKQKISISIVSHGQTSLVNRLLNNLNQHHQGVDLEVILTENIPPVEPVSDQTVNFAIHRITNSKPRGLAANHNQAFKRSNGDFFCLINPDVVLIENIFTRLIANIQDKLGDITAPLIVNNKGEVQDSFRSLPTPFALLKRLVHSNTSHVDLIKEDYIHPDWIAGIILCMRRETFQQLGGMDESYYLYFEDVDFCCRARLAGFHVLLDTRVRAIHEAGRHSRKNIRYFLMHVRSAGRFFLSKTYQEGRRI